MDYTQLPDLQKVSRGFNLRLNAARAISQVEVSAMNGVSDTAAGVIAAGNSGDGLNSVVKCH